MFHALTFLVLTHDAIQVYGASINTGSTTMTECLDAETKIHNAIQYQEVAARTYALARKYPNNMDQQRAAIWAQQARFDMGLE
jgi:hypothetical protein